MHLMKNNIGENADEEAPMKIQGVMTTSPTCCLPSDSASKAARIMKERDTGIVPVIENEQNRRLIGS
jgi:CBS domain-containing protein